MKSPGCAPQKPFPGGTGTGLRHPATLCYALGATSGEEVCRIQGCDYGSSLPCRETTAAKQVRIIANAGLGRMPNLVYDMGCGCGGVAAALIYMGNDAVAVEPLHATVALVDETTSHFYRLPSMSMPFERVTRLKALYMSIQMPDTIIFCESVEHVPVKKLPTTFDSIQDRARGRHCHKLAIMPPDQGTAGRRKPRTRRRRQYVQPPCVAGAKNGRPTRLAPSSVVMMGGIADGNSGTEEEWP